MRFTIGFCAAALALSCGGTTPATTAGSPGAEADALDPKAVPTDTNDAQQASLDAGAAVDVLAAADAPTDIDLADFDAPATGPETAPTADAETIDAEIAQPDQQDGGPTDTGPEATSGWGQPFAVLSLNLHCLKLEGTTFATNQARFAAIAKVVADDDIAAIAVQEACVNGSENAMNLLQAALQDATATAWDKSWVLTHVGWAGTADEAQEGVGVLARGKLLDVQTIEYHAQSGLKRSAIGATLGAAYGSLRVWSVHLDFDNPTVRTLQARETASAAVTLADPSLNVLVAGDLNAQEGSPAHGAFLSYGFLDLTDALNADRIDHVFAHRGAKVALLAAEERFDGKGTPIVSDHPGVLCRIQPGPGQSVSVTRILAHGELGAGKWLAVRGDSAPLDWSLGWVAVAAKPDLWRLVLTEIPQGKSFGYKCLRDDKTWQTGGNAVGVGGGANDLTPQF